MFTLSCSGGWASQSRELSDRVRSAAALGYKAVESLHWLGRDLEAARAAVDETGCVISAILAESADKAANDQLVLGAMGIAHEDAHGAFLQAVGETLEAAKILRCRTIVVTAGSERFDVPREAQRANIVEALRAALPIIAGSGVRLVLEPLNVLVDHAGYYLTTSHEGAQIIREVDSPQVRLLFDIYHQQITEGNLIRNIRQYINEIGHFHVGDVPGRKEPGTGEINYKNVFAAIAETGYEGYVVFECGLTEPVEVVTKKMLDLLPV